MARISRQQTNLNNSRSASKLAATDLRSKNTSDFESSLKHAENLSSSSNLKERKDLKERQSKQASPTNRARSQGDIYNSSAQTQKPAPATQQQQTEKQFQTSQKDSGDVPTGQFPSIPATVMNMLVPSENSESSSSTAELATWTESEFESAAIRIFEVLQEHEQENQLNGNDRWECTLLAGPDHSLELSLICQKYGGHELVVRDQSNRSKDQKQQILDELYRRLHAKSQDIVVVGAHK